MTTQLISSGDLSGLSDEQRMYLLRAAFGPTLSFRPESTEMISSMIDRRLLSVHGRKQADFPELYITTTGRDLVRAILRDEDAKRASLDLVRGVRWPRGSSVFGRPRVLTQ